jgi:hypothetical protein
MSPGSKCRFRMPDWKTTLVCAKSGHFVRRDNVMKAMLPGRRR